MAHAERVEHAVRVRGQRRHARVRTGQHAHAAVDKGRVAERALVVLPHGDRLVRAVERDRIDHVFDAGDELFNDRLRVQRAELVALRNDGGQRGERGRLGEAQRDTVAAAGACRLDHDARMMC